MAIVFAALLVGYFFVLREWLVSRARLNEYAAAVGREAEEHLAWVREERRRHGLAEDPRAPQ